MAQLSHITSNTTLHQRPPPSQSLSLRGAPRPTPNNQPVTPTLIHQSRPPTPTQPLLHHAPNPSKGGGGSGDDHPTPTRSLTPPGLSAPSFLSPSAGRSGAPPSSPCSLKHAARGPEASKTPGWSARAALIAAHAVSLAVWDICRRRGPAIAPGPRALPCAGRRLRASQPSPLAPSLPSPECPSPAPLILIIILIIVIIINGALPEHLPFS
ncbi:uncharacterized protein K452DRAFT_285351 [Aplosporella prunicola CBS 121167]|uniref:Uncharacterized protein n=1 Tax=Aplosporella prunicola CBS 121167 TaxID=1176127 RepID=A0A6A6BL63_9PEZI|nr:uncharacterized protein K452DRAFT_285351 [Aplosporella prunicola CBS 121167]KAF2144123.1 hypothetical protein K452DRAFT_285351 [Aplosporella prunicola CBS 121167]